MRKIEYDLSKTGFNSIFNDWQLKALEAIWASPSGVKSRVVTQNVNQSLKGRTISHTRVIHFLEDMRGMGVIVGEDIRGKGGGYFVYHANLDEDGFKRCIVEKMLGCLMCNFSGGLEKQSTEHYPSNLRLKHPGAGISCRSLKDAASILALNVYAS